MRFFEKDLRIRITFTLLLLVAVSLVSAMVLTNILVSVQIRDNVEDTMLDVSRLIRSVVEVALQRRSSRAELFASFPALRDPNSGAADRTQALRLLTSTWPLGKGSLFLDTGGNVVASTGLLEASDNFSDTEWFKNAQTASITVTYVDGDELQRLGMDSPVLAVSTPLRDSLEQIFGYAVVFSTLSDISAAVDNVQIEETGHAFAVERGGRIIAGKLFEGEGEPSEDDRRTQSDLVASMTTGGGGSQTVSYGGRDYLVTYRPVQSGGPGNSDIDWTVGAAVPADESYSRVGTITWALLGLTGIVLVLAGLAAVFLGRGIARPIEELAASAERIGSGDLTGEVLISSRDQVGTLAAAFLRMRDFLRSALGEAAYTSERMAKLAGEQSAATEDFFNNTEEIVESAIVLTKNLDAQAQKIRRLMEFAEGMPEEVQGLPQVKEVKELISRSEILAEVGMGKAAEIASATREQRAAARDVAAAARRLSEIARELEDMVQRFEV